MSLEKMREEFEAWAKNHWFLCSEGPKQIESGKYLSAELQTAWEAWQASRAAVVVELPEPAPLGDCSPPGLEYSEVVEAIEAAGVKVAP